MKTISSDIFLDKQGCPVNVATVDAAVNDKVSWRLTSTSPGYPFVEAFSVAFGDYNPTYCVNETLVAKADQITCTVMVDARQEPVCYTISTRSNGGANTCSKPFVLRVGSDKPHTCQEP